VKSTRFTVPLNFEKEVKSTVWNNTLTKESGTYTANGLALVEFKFMTTSVLVGAKNKQVIKININQTKNNIITPKQISMQSSKF